MSITEKKQRIESEHPLLSIQKQCELIGSAENLELMEIIDKEYTAHPFYGTRQMRNVLRRKGLFLNRKRIQRLMA